MTHGDPDPCPHRFTDERTYYGADARADNRTNARADSRADACADSRAHACADPAPMPRRLARLRCRSWGHVP